ncbi:AraC family transcriptional regulator [Priestia aryabhattai]|uniref:AraC family transcriptional regulator n=1 Tax=Priestia aryabhattai TaxID=412384 RepID=UPI001C8DFBBD|nr:GyrI-like domain-containing protein [Priestia aryabhattai]MBY0062049.1 GyrI-like domain-containing protein [Priestia aryabhattai]
MAIKIESIPNYRIAYMRNVGPYGPDNVATMENIKHWASVNNLFTDTSIVLGISQDNPQVTPSEDCRYDAAIVISSSYEVDDLVRVGEVLGGEYGVLKVKHTDEDIQKAWSTIFIELHNYGYQLDNRPIFERYTAKMVSDHYCELCVPVKALTSN